MDSDWKSFMEFNNLRSKINDSPNTPYINLNLPDSIIQEDYQLLINSHTNLSAINCDKLEQILQSLDTKTLWEKTSNIHNLTGEYGDTLLVLLLITSLFYYQNKEQRLKILLTFIIYTGLLTYISLNSVLQGRVVLISLALSTA